MLEIKNVVKLNDGLLLPPVGFGTYRLNGLSGTEAIKQAIDAGYRLIDSAFNYENEGAVGAAVRQSPVPRDQLIVTSKLPGRHHKFGEALLTVEESLLRTGLDYIDIYLIHWPNPVTGLYVEAWQAMIEAKKRGLVRSIGVCNFLPEHLDKIISETGVAPCMNQIELHPYFTQEEQRKYDGKHEIVTEAWSPIGRANSVLEEPAVKEIAAAHQKAPTQIILRWHIQLGSLPIPKAASRQHQMENIDIFNFALSSEEMDQISSLSRPDGRMCKQDPAVYEEF